MSEALREICAASPCVCFGDSFPAGGQAGWGAGFWGERGEGVLLLGAGKRGEAEAVQPAAAATRSPGEGAQLTSRGYRERPGVWL